MLKLGLMCLSTQINKCITLHVLCVCVCKRESQRGFWVSKFVVCVDSFCMLL